MPEEEVTDGLLVLRHDGKRHHLQLFDEDIVATSHDGLDHNAGKQWARDTVAQHWHLDDTTGPEAVTYDLTDGHATAVDSWHYDPGHHAWVSIENGHIIERAPHISADDYETAAAWAETVIAEKQRRLQHQA